MAELLDKDRIDTALESLPGWYYDDNKLVKQVPVADDSHNSLEKSVMEVADELNHHPEVERAPGVLRFQLWTHSAGGVTEKDVELAARIDQALSGPATE